MNNDKLLETKNFIKE